MVQLACKGFGLIRQMEEEPPLGNDEKIRETWGLIDEAIKAYQKFAFNNRLTMVAQATNTSDVNLYDMLNDYEPDQNIKTLGSFLMQRNHESLRQQMKLSVDQAAGSKRTVTIHIHDTEVPPHLYTPPILKQKRGLTYNVSHKIDSIKKKCEKKCQFDISYRFNYKRD